MNFWFITATVIALIFALFITGVAAKHRLELVCEMKDTMETD